MNRLSWLPLILVVSLAACDFDNYPAPQSVLEGRVVYDGEPVGVRQNAVELELWQDGYELRQQIPVNVHQDGTFAAKLFDGRYKLVRKQNNGPWVNDPDTIVVELRRSETIDVPVEPYFVIRNEALQLDGDSLRATFDVERVVEGSEVDRVSLYVGTTQFVDTRYNDARVEQTVDPDTFAGSVTLRLDLADLLASGKPLFARMAVKTRGVEEMIYTPVQAIEHP